MLNCLFIDFDAYFASVEQELRPELRGHPVGVVPVMADTTCCIAASYEAKRRGVTTGTGVGEAIGCSIGIAPNRFLAKMASNSYRGQKRKRRPEAASVGS